MKELINLTFFKYYVSDIRKERSKVYNYWQLENILPNYCLNKNGVKHSLNYLQFTGIDKSNLNHKDESFILFNYNFSTELLNNEIDYVGLDYLFNNFKISEKIYDCLEKGYFNINEYGLSYFPKSTNLILDLEYKGDFQDMDIYIKFNEYLNDNYEKINI